MRGTRRWIYLVLLLAVAVGGWRLHMDVQILNLLPSDLKVVEGLKLYQEHFSNNRELIVTLRATDMSAADTAVESLANTFQSHSNLVETVRWRPPWFEDPALSSELLAYIWLNQKPEDFRQLADRLVETNLPGVLQETKEKLATSFSPGDIARSAYDPFGLTQLPESTASQIPASMRDQNWFASEDGTYHVLFVQARPALTDYTECIKWINAIQGVVAEWKSKNPGITVRYTGPPAFVAETSQGMRQDLIESVLGTMVLIGLLFWVAYRRWIPLVWTLFLLTLIVAGTLALGGLFLGTLNVVSLGFAGILLGVTVDYALVLYQASLANPDKSAIDVKRMVQAGILWSATTTAGAFLILRFSGLPGLGQLGTLVAIGITTGSGVMLAWFLPPLKLSKKSYKVPNLPGFTRNANFAWSCTAIIAVLVIGGWIYRRPAIDYSGEALSPGNSQAFIALKEMEKELDRAEEPYLALTRGRTEQEVLQRLEKLNGSLTNALAHHEIASFMLPLLIWPRPEAQVVNRETARLLSQREDVLKRAAATGGFSTNAMVLAHSLLSTWGRMAEATNVVWPTNELSRWILQRVVARETNGFLAMGPVYPLKSGNMDWARQLPQEETWLTGWQPLAGELFKTITGKIVWILAGVIGLLAISLWLAFRRWREVFLGFFTLALSGLALCAVMQVSGWKWNLLNVMALPLLLGAGVDYTILMQLALRRHRGDVAATHREIGIALLLSSMTAAIGFGSLAWASNAGLASLGRICAVGIFLTGFAAVFLLPFWWRLFDGAETVQQPSSAYTATFWRMGLAVARNMPRRILVTMTEFLTLAYWAFCPSRRKIVTQNLLPVLHGDEKKARIACRQLYRNFGRKLVDLWRCEAGFSPEKILTEFAGLEIFATAQKRKQGVLLITPHLGNWEVGGYALAERGIKLHVITLAEPGAGLTELRLDARAKKGIETIVIRDDPFAFVEIIKRLQEGAVFALLLDRPPQPGSVMIELFGKPFRASLAAAELARASGCMLVPTFLIAKGDGYAVEILPEIPYDRAALNDRVARLRLTQEILRGFEPAIERHADQWYHFVPIWPDASGDKSK